MRPNLCLLIVILPAAFAGCGKGPQAPPSILPQTQPASSSSRPSTQSVLDGPRTELPLHVMPLSLRVPQGWKTEFLESSMILKGPAPQGDIEIAISSLPLISADRIDVLTAGAQHQMQIYPGQFRGGEIDTINGLRAFETLRFRGAAEAATVSWNLIIFVPRNNQFVPCNFNLRMSQDQFNSDEAFLRSIFKSAQRAQSPLTR